MCQADILFDVPVSGFTTLILIVTETNISSHEFIYELRRCFKQLRRLQANWQHGPPYRNDFATDEQMFEGGKMSSYALVSKGDYCQVVSL